MSMVLFIDEVAIGYYRSYWEKGYGMIERVIRLEGELMSVDTRLALAEQNSRQLHRKLDTLFYWMLAGFGGLYASIAVLFAKVSNWM